MAMKRCPICGEKYSETYKNCPFCEEEAALQEGGDLRRGSRHGTRVSRSRQFNLITPTLIVLIIIMAALLIYLLYGSQLAERFGGSQEEPNTEDVVPPDTTEPEDGTIPEDETGTDSDAEPDAGSEPDGSDTAAGSQGADEEPDALDYETVNALPSGLVLSTTDFTLKNLGETATIKVTSGGSGSYTWVSEDDGIASVDSSGKVTAVSGGTIHVLVTDGTKKGVCIVRVTASGSLPAAPSGGDNGSGGAHKLNQEDFTRPVREGPYQLKVSGVTTAITWTSSDTSVATVSSTGLVTPVGAGTATITASWDGQSLSCIVRVPG